MPVALATQRAALQYRIGREARLGERRTQPAVAVGKFGVMLVSLAEERDPLTALRQQMRPRQPSRADVVRADRGADIPENYAKYPRSFKFIRDVPTDWQDTRVLGGEVGDYATIARKVRGGQDWYVGAVGDEQARTVTFSFDFLSPGKRYQAELYRDGDDADYRTDKRHSIVIETKVVTAKDSMTLRLAPGGGAAVRLHLIK